jgi:hypothetical protein
MRKLIIQDTYLHRRAIAQDPNHAHMYEDEGYTLTFEGKSGTFRAMKR